MSLFDEKKKSIIFFFRQINLLFIEKTVHTMPRFPKFN